MKRSAALRWGGLVFLSFLHAAESASLPHCHAYQNALRAWLASLTVADLEVPIQPFGIEETPDLETCYRLWMIHRHLPSLSGLARPPEGFTLAALERDSPPILPAEPSECHALAFWSSWPYSGNPYYGHPGVKRRALVLAISDMILLDDLHERNPTGEACRADYLGGNLIWLSDTFRHAGDILPPESRQAYREGLKKLADRLMDWGPKGAMTDMDLFASVGLWYTQAALQEPAFTRRAEAYARSLFTDPAFFHPAGYFVDHESFDVSYNGISLYFATWAALASNWNFAQEALRKALALRAHLMFPDPDGKSFSGPSAMSPRTSGDAARDQWQFDPRMQGQAMLSDEALFTAIIPSTHQLTNAPQQLAAQLNRLSVLPSQEWKWRETHWSRHLPYAAMDLPTSHLARLLSLSKDRSPLLLSPFQRNIPFLKSFGDAFVIGRFSDYAFAIHTGPVGPSFGHRGLPYGFGGGQLCAYWTPASGATLLTRRRGVQGTVTDSWDEWSSWPIHAVTGLDSDGWLITSARIRQPTVEHTLSPTSAFVRVQGMLPRLNPHRREEERSDYAYERRFLAFPDRLVVETVVRGGADCRTAFLYETLPIFLSESPRQPPATIRCQNDSEWRIVQPQERSDNVTALQVQRFEGGMEIQFEKPVQLDFSSVWNDGYQTQARCLTVRVLLSPTDDLRSPPSCSLRYFVHPISKTPTQTADPP